MAQARIATVIFQCPFLPGTKTIKLRAARPARPAPAPPAPGRFFPRQHDQYGGQQPQHQRQKRHDPCHPIEPGASGSGQNRGTVFLYEVLQRQIVVLSAIQARNKFAAHPVRISAAHVIAFQQNLAAAADAHQPVAQTVEARCLRPRRQGRRTRPGRAAPPEKCAPRNWAMTSQFQISDS